MSRVCLLIVFNHKYNKNIPMLQKIYGKRFSNIYYLVPFNSEIIEGLDMNHVISVYESSYYFQGYFAQAYEKIKYDSYEHYVIIGDDQILNPSLDENNIIEKMGLENKDSFIKKIVPYGKSGGDKSNKLYTILSPFRINTGISYKLEIPTKEEAELCCKKHGYEVTDKLPWSFLLKKGYVHPKYILQTLVCLLINRGRKLPYPLFKAYSDMIIIDATSMELFCRYSGVFAAMNIFVETAIPLAMILSCERIKEEKDLKRYHGVENWGVDIEYFEDKYKKDLNYLFDNFSEDVLYYHPIKLSKWQYEE